METLKEELEQYLPESGEWGDFELKMALLALAEAIDELRNI